jgi:hypothetical protein
MRSYTYVYLYLKLFIKSRMKIKEIMLMKISTNMNNICSIPNIYDNRVLLLQFRKETQHFRQIIIIIITILILIHYIKNANVFVCI